MKLSLRLSLTFIVCTCICTLIYPQVAPDQDKSPKPPRLTVVFVIDQFPARLMENLKQFFPAGFKSLLEHGVVYQHAHHPHCLPTTATGHAAMNTGTVAKNHGITANSWYDELGTTKIPADAGDPKKDAILSAGGTPRNKGISPRYVMVDGVSDQMKLAPQNELKHVYAISLKSRAAVMLANKIGKAIWFEEQENMFTSSKDYFSELPDWLNRFNKATQMPKLDTIHWQLLYPHDSKHYQFEYARDERFIAYTMQVKNNILHITAKNGGDVYHTPYGYFGITPAANNVIIAAAKACIEEHMKTSQDSMLIWVSISTPDMIGHICGPQSIAAIDTLYHCDKYIGDFMQYLEKKFKPEEILYALTSDHGVASIPELAAEKGLNAQRVDAKALVNELNELIKKNYQLENLITQFSDSQFYINNPLFESLAKEKQHTLCTMVKEHLQKKSYIKNVWTPEDLLALQAEPYSFEWFYKEQLYPGRTGKFIVMPQPYAYIEIFSTGTGHATPYHYDTQVPLIIMQKNVLSPKTVLQKVWVPQLAPTLAHLLHIQKPAASTFGILPGIANSPVNAEVAIAPAIVSAKPALMPHHKQALTLR